MRLENINTNYALLAQALNYYFLKINTYRLLKKCKLIIYLKKGLLKRSEALKFLL